MIVFFYDSFILDSSSFALKITHLERKFKNLNEARGAKLDSNLNHIWILIAMILQDGISDKIEQYENEP